MKKTIKIIPISIVIVFFILICVPASSLTNYNLKSSNLGLGSIFSLDSNVVVSYDTEKASKLISPLKETIQIPITVRYQVIGLYANFFTKRLNKATDACIDLEIESSSVPSFCSASINPSMVQAPITTELTSSSTKPILFVTVNENAPAFEDFIIRIIATSKEVYGIISKIEEDTVIGEVRVKVDYYPLIIVEKEYNYKKISPLNVTTLSYKIENFGNGPTEVFIEIEDPPEDWSISFPKSIILESAAYDKDNKGIVEIQVKPNKTFTNETLKISFTPCYERDPDKKGNTYTISTVLENDGSLKSENEIFENNLSLLIIVITIIILVIIGIILYKRRK